MTRMDVIQGIKSACATALAIAIASAGTTLATAQDRPKAPSSRPADTQTPVTVTVERIGNGPVIRPDMPGLKGKDGDNINGPAVIRVPDWVKQPLGRYYMYFAHHRGTYIRLAYADRPEGPWKVYEPGTLRLEQTSALHHIASPDVIVDDANKRFILYYHGAVETPGRDYGGRPYRQDTMVATSSDGLSFTAQSGVVAGPYFKTFQYRGAIYGLAMSDKESAYPLWLRSGQFFRSETGLAPFDAGPRILDEMRHGGVVRIGDALHIFYTTVGDSPERIFQVKVDLRPDWTEWTASAPKEVLRPARTYEGANLPLTTSRGGPAAGAENALRDPTVLNDNGDIYLYYSVAGELGIAVARVRFSDAVRHAGK